MIRATLAIISIGLIFLGLWLISSGFMTSEPTSPAASQVIAAPQQKANPVGLGTALLAGGVVFLVVVLRRK
jgi:Na+/phosphate symporter